MSSVIVTSNTTRILDSGSANSGSADYCNQEAITRAGSSAASSAVYVNESELTRRTNRQSVSSSHSMVITPSEDPRKEPGGKLAVLTSPETGSA